MLESYRPLIRLWAGILSLSAVGVATLQVLGPPAARALRPGGTQTAAPPALPRADQPVAAASLPSAAAVEQPAPVVSPTPAVPAQPNHRRARSWVRKGVSPTRVPGDQGIGDDGFLAERGQSEPQSGPVPQDRAALPPLAARNQPSQPSAYQHVAGYIGIFTTGADGTRVFRATP